jgi:Protein of unknown function (DUF5663)
MIKLDENLLVELGLGSLPKPEKTAFLKHMYETLEMRVGTRLAERMSDQQMSEFEQFISSNDEQGAFQWLEGNFPNYKEVVAEEFEKLKGEIMPLAPQIVSASQAQAAQIQGQGSVNQPLDQPQQPAYSDTPSQPPVAAPALGAPSYVQPSYPQQQAMQQPVQPAQSPASDFGPSADYQGSQSQQPQPAAQSFQQPQPMPASQPQYSQPAQAQTYDPYAQPANGGGQPQFGQGQAFGQPSAAPQPQPTQDYNQAPMTPPPFQQAPSPAAASMDAPSPYGPAPSFGQPTPQQPPAYGGGQQFPPQTPPSSYGPGPSSQQPGQ